MMIFESCVCVCVCVCCMCVCVCVCVCVLVKGVNRGYFVVSLQATGAYARFVLLAR